MPVVDFIPVKESEVHTLGVLRQKAWAATYRGIYPDEMIDQFDFEWHREKDLLRLRHPQYRNWFIQAKGETVGYLTLRHGEPMLLQSLYLLPQAQKQGVGRQAFKFVCQYCSERGIEKGPFTTLQCDDRPFPFCLGALQPLLTYIID